MTIVELDYVERIRHGLGGPRTVDRTRTACCAVGSFSGVKRLGRKVNYSPPSGADVTNKWSYSCTASVYLRGVDGENCTFLPYAHCVARVLAAVCPRSACCFVSNQPKEPVV